MVGVGVRVGVGCWKGWKREANDPVSFTSFFRSSEHKNAYENVLEEEGRVRSTPM